MPFEKKTCHLKIIRQNFNSIYHKNFSSFFNLMMHDHSVQFSFQELPKAYQSLFNEIKNGDKEDIQNLYSLFRINYYDCQSIDDDAISSLTTFLQDYKFITYEVNYSPSPNNDQFLDNFVNVIMCMENQILYLEMMNIQTFYHIYSKFKSSIVMINTNLNSFEHIDIDPLLNEEILNFSNFLTKNICNNKFIQNTIRPMSAYIIRRYFYPSNHFRDQSFFSYSKLKENQSFNSKDFIYLRSIQTDNKEIFLVIHIKTFYIFNIIKYVNARLAKHEIEFCKNFLLIKPCKYFIQFFGFLVENDKINGCIYEYMPNGTFPQYIAKNTEKNSEIYLLKIMKRLINGIEYLHSNGLIYRDIKPSNILVDHNENLKFSDYESIRNEKLYEGEEMTNDIGSMLYSSPEQFEGKNVSFATDIYSFGQIIYFLFQHKDMYEKVCLDEIFSKKCQENITQMTNVSDEIQELCNQCLKCDQNKRPTIANIKGTIYCVLGKNYLEIKNDLVTAEKYLNKAIDLNCPDAWFYKAILYIDKKNDFENGIKYALQSEKLNDPKGLNLLGTLYLIGKHVQKDVKKAFNYLEIAANAGNNKALCNIGSAYLNGIGVPRNVSKGLEYLDKAAKKGFISAIYFLGQTYYSGEIVEKDIKKSIEYFELNAEKNDANSLNSLGYIYSEGRGIEKDYEKAKKYFELSAKQNNTIAFYNLGKMHYKGNGVVKDIYNAISYFEKAASDGHSDALYYLGIIYYNGIDNIEKDHDKAMKCFMQSAEKNNSNSLYYLGKIYFENDKNYEKGIEYYQLAAEENNSDALYALGKIYHEGKVVKKNCSEAIKYFKTLTSLKNPEPYFNLGLIYEKGDDVDRNIDQAIQYYTKCASNEKYYLIYRYDSAFYEIDGLNSNYYLANNNLGLLYITDFQNLDKAINYIKTAGLSQYSYGQNNYGLLCQYYLDKPVKAEDMYKSSSENHFPLAEFNLGIMQEKNGFIQASLDHYIEALKYKKEPLIFQNKIINDERLNISKLFIFCFINLKLTRYYLLNGQLTYAQLYFIDALTEPLCGLLAYSQYHSYSFQFQMMKNEENKSFSNIKDFFLNFPLFNLEKRDSSSSWNLHELHQNDNPQINITLIRNENIVSNEIDINIMPNLSQDEIDKIGKTVPKGLIESSIRNILTCFDFQNMTELNNTNDFSNNDENQNKIEITSDEDNSIKSLIYPKNIDEIILFNDNYIIEEITDIINQMDEILFTPPYSILFGRIKIYSLKSFKF